jgi:hypothetical protein
MNALSALLYILAYLLAVVDGIQHDTGNYPSGSGRTGLSLFTREHPWIVAGAASGALGSIVGFV